MADKLFRDVFPGLKLDKNLDELLGQTEIQKITMFKGEKKMVISILSKNLIAKELIFAAEEQMTQFIFGDSGEKCIIDEHYELSKQYNLTQLSNIYKDSFLEEG